MVARLISLPPVCRQCLHIRMRIIVLCLRLVEKQLVINRLTKKPFSRSVEAKYVCTFELMFGYTYVAGYLSRRLQVQFACTGQCVQHSFRVLTYARTQRNIWYTRAYTRCTREYFSSKKLWVYSQS